MTTINDGRDEALRAIRKTHARGPTAADSLTKRHVPRSDPRLEKAARLFDEVNCGLIATGRSPLAGFKATGAGPASLDAIAKIHRAGARPLFKGGALPPQSVNSSTEVGAIAATGGNQSFRDQSVVGDVRPTRATAPHAASLHDLVAGPTQKRDATVEALKNIHAAGSQPLFGRR